MIPKRQVIKATAQDLSLLKKMISYSRILQKAYHITMQSPILWLFGLFVIGSLNVNFLHFEDPLQLKMPSEFSFYKLLYFFQSHPGFLALASLSVLIFSVAGLLVTNWSRIMLILVAENIINKKHLTLKEIFLNSKSFVLPVIKLSLLTASLMVVVAVCLFFPPLFLVKESQAQNLLWTMASFLFLPLAFTISCLNIFSSFFIILFKKSLSSSVTLGTDFFVSRWTEILGLVVMLSIIYLCSFAVGISLIYVAKLVISGILEFFLKFNIFSVSAMIWIIRVIFGMLLWLLLSGLNVFFNVSLFLLFIELITPIKSEEVKEKEMAVSPVVP